MSDMTHIPIIATLVENYIDQRLAITTQALQAQLAETEELRVIAVAEREELRSTLANVQADADAASEAVDRLTADGERKSALIAGLETTIATRDATIQSLRDRIAELETGTPEVRRTVLGGTPWSGYASETTRDAVVARWGKGVAVRLFNREANTLAVAPARGDAGPLLVSWKPTSLDVITDDAVRAALANLVPGDMTCCWHEPDVKVKDEIKARGQAAGDTLAKFYKDLAWKWYTTAKRVRPDLDVFACSSAWLFDPTNASDDPARYFERRAFDVFGIDYDGLSGPKDYRQVTPRVQAWLRSVDCTRYILPEYGVKTRTTAPAFTNEMRPAWIDEQTGALIADPWPPEIICLYENDTSTEGRKYNLTTTAEKAAWDAKIAATA